VVPSLRECKLSLIVYLYGVYAEYPFRSLERELSLSGIQFKSCLNWSENDFKRSLDQEKSSKVILVTSAHPGINFRSGRNNISVANLRRLFAWSWFVYYPHDLTEPVRWQERMYLSDYDFVLTEESLPDWIHSYVDVVQISRLQRDKTPLDSKYDFLFLPDDFYSFANLPPEFFVKRFPFSISKNVVTKTIDAPGAETFTAELSKKIETLTSKIPGRNLIHSDNGVVITNGLSGVIMEAKVAGVPVVFYDEKGLSPIEEQTLKSKYSSIVAILKPGDELPPTNTLKILNPSQQDSGDGIKKFVKLISSNCK
jgi:hypothetical protein